MSTVGTHPQPLRRPDHPAPGIITFADGMELGAGILLPMVIVWLLAQLHLITAIDTAVVQAQLSESFFTWVTIALRVLEAGIITHALWTLSHRRWHILTGGLLWALLLHLLVTGLLYTVMPAATLFRVAGEPAAVVQLIVMIAVLRMLTVPTCQILSRLLGDKTRRRTASVAGRYTFHDPASHRPAAKSSAPSIALTRKIQQIGVQNVRPPEGLVMMKPCLSARGTVTIPREVVLDSIPDAEKMLAKDQPVRIPLAYIVPQLHRPTMWLTWGHVRGIDLPAEMRPTALPDAPELDHQWLRVPCRHILPQIPREYFERTKTAPAWARLPKVPQEDLLAFAAGARPQTQ